MIQSIRVANFRGIQSGAIEGLSPLTVLVGPSGAGKSSMIEALLIAAGTSPGDAVGRVVQRRMELMGGARWLFWRGGHVEGAQVQLHLEHDDRAARDVTLRLFREVSALNEEKLAARRALAPYVEIESIAMEADARLLARTACAYGDNAYVFHQDGALESPSGTVRLIDPRPGGLHPVLWRSAQEAIEQGRMEEVEAIVREVVPEIRRLQLVADDSGMSILHAGFKDRSVPVALAGDGIHGLVHVALSVAQPPGSVVLLEEPESAQHPRAASRTAAVIAAAVQRGVQVILTTHSLEFIDWLLVPMEARLEKMSLHHMVCRDGALVVARFAGTDVDAARDVIGEDFR